MKKIVLVLFTVFTINCSYAQKKDSTLSERATNATPVENLIKLECTQQKISLFNRKICNASEKINLSRVNKTLVELKMPPLPEPCDNHQNCNIKFDKNIFLRSYIIEKYLSVIVVDEEGQTINEIEKINYVKISDDLNATYLQFKKPIEPRGFLQIKAFSEELGGMFAVNINLDVYQ